MPLSTNPACLDPFSRALLRSRVLRDRRHLAATKKHVQGLSQEVLNRRVLAGRDDAELPGDLGREVPANMFGATARRCLARRGRSACGPVLHGYRGLVRFIIHSGVPFCLWFRKVACTNICNCSMFRAALPLGSISWAVWPLMGACERHAVSQPRGTDVNVQFGEGVRQDGQAPVVEHPANVRYPQIERSAVMCSWRVWLRAA